MKSNRGCDFQFKSCNFESQTCNFANYFTFSRAGQGLTSVTPRKIRKGLSALDLCHQWIVFSRRDKRTLMGWSKGAARGFLGVIPTKKTPFPGITHAAKKGLKALLIRSLIYMTIPSVWGWWVGGREDGMRVISVNEDEELSADPMAPGSIPARIPGVVSHKNP